MPHVDEGTLHALLDGELDASTLHEVQTHFATCPACAARLAEAKQLIAETERLVNALEVPGGPRRESGPAADPWAAPGFGPPPPLDPVVLIPDNPTPTEIRRSRLKVLAWAAALVLVAGGSFAVIRGGRTPPSLEQLRIRPEEFTSAPPPGAAPTGQPAAPAGLDTGAAGGPGRTLAAAPAPAPTPVGPAPGRAQPPATARRAAAGREAQPPAREQAAARTAPAPKRAPPAQPKAADTGAAAAGGGGGGGGGGGADTGARGDGEATEADRQAVAARAAAATAALDRERERTRDAAAMARLDSINQARRRALQAAESAAALPERPAPARPTPEQQAGVTGRIGLDEATRQLGGPLHAIDAASVTRQFVGLAPGAGVPGADATRPVVRAVYVDRVGRRLYLDQQRVRPGQAAGLGPTPETGPGGVQRWLAGSVLLVLHGDLPPDSLRALAQRVR